MFLPRVRAALAIIAISASLAGCATGQGYVGAEAGPTTIAEAGTGGSNATG